MSVPPLPGDDIPRCPVCLSPCRSDQRYCLECGARLPAGERAAGRLDALARMAVGRRHVVAVGIALLALVGVASAWALTRDDGGGRRSTSGAASTHRPGSTSGHGAGSSTAPSTDDRPAISVSTQGSDATIPPQTTFGTDATTIGPPTTEPTTSAPSTTIGETTQPAPTTEPEPTTATTTEPPPPEEPTDEWTDDGSWAVILSSKDAGSVTVAALETARQRAEDRGLSPVGILVSDNWGSLNPGYWVLYEGPYPSRAAASSAARRAIAAGYGGAYPRRVASS